MSVASLRGKEKTNNEIFDKTNNKYVIDGSNGKIDGNGTGVGTIPVEVGKKVEKTEKNNYTDNDGNTATVPKDFAIVPGCEDISEGLVISDIENDIENTGNQFVWVPVSKSEFVRIAGYSNKAVQSFSTDIYKEPYENGYKDEIKEYEEMYNHVVSYKGFYIGRYESGKDSTRNVVIKKEADIYNNVPWGNSMMDITETTNTKGKIGAVKLSKDFATSLNSRIGVDLIYNKNPSVIANKQKNIYDMAGNVTEWTMEANNTEYRVTRGGSHDSYGYNIPASHRFKHNSTDSTDNIGFRISLYL